MRSNLQHTESYVSDSVPARREKRLRSSSELMLLTGMLEDAAPASEVEFTRLCRPSLESWRWNTCVLAPAFHQSVYGGQTLTTMS